MTIMNKAKKQVITLMVAVTLMMPMTFALADMKPIEVGSPKWWEDTKGFELRYRQELKKYPKNSIEYKTRDNGIDHIQKQKCIVGRLYGLPKNSPEYKAIYSELLKVDKEYRAKHSDLISK